MFSSIHRFCNAVLHRTPLSAAATETSRPTYRNTTKKRSCKNCQWTTTAKRCAFFAIAVIGFIGLCTLSNDRASNMDYLLGRDCRVAAPVHIKKTESANNEAPIFSPSTSRGFNPPGVSQFSKHWKKYNEHGNG